MGGNTINLLPPVVKQETRVVSKRLKYDVIMIVMVAIVVFFAAGVILTDSIMKNINDTTDRNIAQGKELLAQYKPLLSRYSLINNKYDQIKAIKDYRVNPTDVINYINDKLPPNTTLSNFKIDSSKTFEVTISNSDYINIAKLLVTFEKPGLKITEIQVKTISFSGNIINFTISGVYNPDGK